MTCTRRRLRAIGAVAAGALVLGAYAASGSAAQPAHAAKGTVTFAQLNDFTGVGSAVVPYQNASQLSALYDINAAGGILGNTAQDATIDTKSDPADGVLALNRALAVSKISVVSGPSTIQAAALVPLLTILYLYDVDEYEDEPLRVVAVTILWGAAAGIGVGLLGRHIAPSGIAAAS